MCHCYLPGTMPAGHQQHSHALPYVRIDLTSAGGTRDNEESVFPLFRIFHEGGAYGSRHCLFVTGIRQ